ncbi:MAG: glycosyltransferase family 2 protein [Burkholderiales bacterium]|nr:glycosyltransferase family 2 protein [Burkholderiales bacterium]
MNAPVPTSLAHPDPTTVDRRPLVTLVLPCFNEAGVLREHYAEIAAYLETLVGTWRFEVLLIDDGSVDATGATAHAIGASDIPLRVIHHPGNFGLGQAFKTAFAASRGDYVVTLDIDLSYAPEHIGRLLEAIRTQRAKLVLASAYMTGGVVSNVPWLRRTLSLWGNRFLRVFARGGLSTLTCMVRAYDGPFVRALVLRSTGMEIMPELIYKTMVMRGRIVEVPAELDWSRQLQAGPRRVSSMRIWRHVLSTIVSGFMLRPFAMMMAPGLALLVLTAGLAGSLAWRVAALRAGGAASWQEALAAVLAAHPHAPLACATSAVLAVLLLGLGLVALQTKRYFEDLYHLGVTLRAASLGEIRREPR